MVDTAFNDISCKCSLLSHKVREIFSVLCEKEQYLYIETYNNSQNIWD